VATEIISAKKPKGDVLVFRRGRGITASVDIESSSSLPKISKYNAVNEVQDIVSIEKHSAIFHWKDVCFDISVDKEQRRILDHVDGWIKPGILTALMVLLR
jgi:hypothetical protein